LRGWARPIRGEAPLGTRAALCSAVELQQPRLTPPPDAEDAHEDARARMEEMMSRLPSCWDRMLEILFGEASSSDGGSS
jgi:hypothetical protein